MNKEEHDKQKELIISQYGKPEWDMGDPVNESAKKLVELRQSYAKAKSDINKTKRLAENVKELTSSLPQLKNVVIPDEIIRNEWLITFNELQKQIVTQWSKNIKQNVSEIAIACKCTNQQVKQTLGLEAFQHLRSKLANAYKDLLPLEASAALRDCLYSQTENVRFNAIKMVLVDAGIYKDQNSEPIKPVESVLDKETQEKLRKLGDHLI
jgi:hypothetical protein